MTCYFRHIKRIFEEIGFEVTKENKREVDKNLHRLVGIEYKDCSSVWKEVKKRMAEDEDSFVSSLKAVIPA
ncbi:MAG: hypothetical protein ACW99U_05065 [Candidatus Thorarchaeota archaeon]|jgi:hypothetical protein